MFHPTSRFLCACLCILTMALIASGQSNLSAKVNSLQPTAADGAAGDSDRSRDGLAGPVRRVRTEVVKLSTVAGKSVEEPKRVLLETAEYDVKGVKTQNQYFPIAGSELTGREVYKYDEKGNISEMTLLNADGTLLSKEMYKYEFDSIGNWVKMTTSVAVVANGKVDFEPTEVTYRTILYYLDASVAKTLQPANPAVPATGTSAPANGSSQPVASSSPANGASQPVASSSPAGGSKPANSNSGNDPKVTATAPPRTTTAKLNGSSVQQVNMDLKSLNDPGKANVVSNDEPPPAAPRTILKPVSGGVLNGKALSLPAPVYPEIARRSRTSGKVEVEVVVDENGKVISARAVSGPPTLREVAAEAASRARFSPTKLSGQPVKIVGRIDYNFTLP